MASSASLKSPIPVPSKETPTRLYDSPTPSHLTKPKAIFLMVPLHFVPSILYVPLLSPPKSCAAAVTTSRILPHLKSGSLQAFICSCAILLNLSAAMSTIALTVMRVELDFRLDHIQGLGRRARFLYLHCESSLSLIESWNCFINWFYDIPRDSMHNSWYGLSGCRGHTIWQGICLWER
jgi:hypothetical protein